MTAHLPLVVVDEEDLLDDVLRLAASVGCDVECAPDVDGSHSGWTHRPLIVLDQNSLTRCTGSTLPNAATILVVCQGDPTGETWQRAFHAGVEQVLALPADESRLIAALADLVDGASSQDGQMLAVVGGRGGAGASVFAASVATAACHAGGNALLVDCDVLAGGIDLVLGAELDDGTRWPELSLTSGRVSMNALRDALPRFDYPNGELSVLSCGRDAPGPTADSVAAVADAGKRSGYTVVCDLARDLTDCGQRAVELADLTCLVVPAEIRACTAARQVAARLRALTDQLGVVVRGPAPEALPADAVSEAVELDLLAAMRAEPRLTGVLERGEFRPRARGPLAAAARTVLDTLHSDVFERGAA